jgi:hypothetical protein
MSSWLRTLSRVPSTFGAATAGTPSNGHSHHPAGDDGEAAPGTPAAGAPPAPASPSGQRSERGEGSSGPAATPDAQITDETDSPAGGVHRITRKTNYWFEREIHVIERDAEQSAVEWAQKGLPRHDVPRTEPLEPEQVLAKRCAQLFREWQLRVKTKMQDAIEESGRELADHVATLRAKVARLETVAHELADREQRIERLRRETEQDERPVRYAPMIPRWGFWAGAIALGAVEFMANFPVFRLMLPMNAALAKVASGIADTVDPESIFAGLTMLVAEWATHLEAVVVAFVAVVVLVVLGKFVGTSARARFALHADDYPTAARTVRAHQREHVFKGAASVLGIAFVLLFLFFSRADIAELTAERVRQDSTAVAAAETRLADAQARRDDAAIVARNDELLQLRDVLVQHEEDERYAATVQRNNVPILFLNLALVITAAVLGYAYAYADLGEKRGEHPDLVRLRERCVELRGEQIALDHDARAAAAQAHLAASRVRQLLGAHPLRGWESKVRRLESVLPRFRGENARTRGLDPANIRAFDDPPQLDLPPVDEHVGLAEPAEFTRLRDELQELALRLASLAPRPLSRESAATA